MWTPMFSSSCKVVETAKDKQPKKQIVGELKAHFWSFKLPMQLYVS